MKASKVRANYFVGVAIQGMEEEVAMLAQVIRTDWLTDERLGLIHQAYLATADALELLHSQLGQTPYSRIEMMIGRGIIKGMTLDNKTIKALKREKCHACMRSKNTDAAKLTVVIFLWKALLGSISRRKLLPFLTKLHCL